MQILHLGPKQSQVEMSQPYNNRKNKNYSQQNNNSKKNLYVVVPYYQGLSESIKKSCKKFGVQVHFKGGVTIRNLLMTPKDKDHILKKVESYTNTLVIGWSAMKRYIGESTRTFTERFKEHQKAPSLIYDHSIRSGHEVHIDNFSIVGREDQNLIRAIKKPFT